MFTHAAAAARPGKQEGTRHGKDEMASLGDGGSSTGRGARLLWCLAGSLSVTE